jgi:hypothetical protein
MFERERERERERGKEKEKMMNIIGEWREGVRR